MKSCFLIIVILFVFNACTSSTNQPTNGASPANSIPANANTPAAATNSNPSGMQPYNGVQNINPNAFNASNDNLKVIRVEPKKDELPYGSRNAPDESIVSSGSRGKDFVETRTFKNHPQIAKVEKIMDGTTNKYKVYLKNGKVLDAPEDKMTNFSAMAPANILDAVGMLPKPQPQTAPTEKKDQNQ